jgi:hypothetical protein
MGQALEMLTGNATAPGATFTALTMAVGNTSTIRSADMRSQVGLMGAWAFSNGAGILRIRSPRLHDNQQGIRMVINALTPSPRYPAHNFIQPLVPQDVLTLEITGSATAGNIEMGSILVYYSDLPGIAARFINCDQLARWGVNVMGQQVAVTAGATGGYSGQVAVNSLAGADQWKANTDYALMGYVVDTPCCSVRIQGADSGNLGVGGPGFSAVPDVTRDWFALLSDRYGLSLIPVFNAANKNAILVDVAQNNGAAAVNVTFNFVELKMPSLRT